MSISSAAAPGFQAPQAILGSALAAFCLVAPAAKADDVAVAGGTTAVVSGNDEITPAGGAATDLTANASGDVSVAAAGALRFNGAFAINAAGGRHHNHLRSCRFHPCK